MNRPTSTSEPGRDQPDRPNHARAENARFAVASSLWARGENPRDPDEEALADLLTDLRHLSAALGLDYERCERLAEMHFEAEAREEADAHGAPNALDVLRQIASIPIWGDHPPSDEVKAEWIETDQYEPDGDYYSPSCDTESSELQYAVELARAALKKGGLR